ncbi:MAG: lipase [Gammaproteobacteria bacterium 39-13]|nr:alpha/beta hydrolase [Gammaproteobacteria bacterium]OJV90464.1 MAG: lipase [Gammaproteobacteria bacterium 39-13]
MNLVKPFTLFSLLSAASQIFAATIVLEPETQQFIDGLAKKNAPPIYTLSPTDARAVLDNAQANAEKFPVDIEERKIPTGTYGDVPIHIIRPKDNHDELPVVMYFHGGGWILGDFGTHERLLSEIANGAKVAVVYVDYSRSPEAKFPVPLEQAYAATKWIAENGKSLKLDTSRLAVAGDSVGGNMATAVALLAKEHKGPKIDFQLLFYPVTDAAMDTASYKEFAEGPWLTRKAMEWFWDAYAPNKSDRKKITVSPLQASIKELSGLPPALIITDENDVLRDEGEAYGRKLSQAGVKVTAVRYLGTIHDFVMLNAIAKTPAARAAIEQANDALKKNLQKNK